MNIFVSNLNPSVTNFQLKKLFSTYGKVLSVNITVNESLPKSIGLGCVNISELSTAYAAILSLNNTLFLGNLINVSEINPYDEQNRINNKKHN